MCCCLPKAPCLFSNDKASTGVGGVSAGRWEEGLPGSMIGFLYSPQIPFNERPVITPAYIVLLSRRSTKMQHYCKVQGLCKKACGWLQGVGRSGTAALRLGAGKAWSAMWHASSRSAAPSSGRSSSHKPACSQVHMPSVYICRLAV